MKNKTQSAIIWSGLDVLIRQAFSFIISVIMARLLLPEDFGIVSLLSIFIGIANLFINVGLNMALIQGQDITHTDESTVFWFNLTVALGMMAILIILAPWIALFFVIPILTPITQFFAINIVLNAMGSIHSAIMTKNLDFKTLMKVGVISTCISGGVGCCMALSELRYWSLVGQVLTGSAVSTVLFWFFSSWRPKLIFSTKSFRKLFAFSGWILVSGLIDVVYQRGYALLIGKYYGSHDLGIYNRADNTQSLASGIFTDIISRVAFPLYASMSHETEQIQRSMRAGIQSMTFIIAPVMVGLFTLAEPFIYVVYGEKWLPAVSILQVLCIIGLLYPLQVINLNVLQALGYSHLFFKIEMLKKILGVIFLVGGAFFGLIGIAYGRVVASIFALFINTYYTNKFLGYKVTAQVKDCLSNMGPALIMGGAIVFFTSNIVINSVALLILSIIIGVLIYLLIHLLIGSKSIILISSLMKNYLQKYKCWNNNSC